MRRETSRSTEILELLLESKRGRLFCLELPLQPIAGRKEFRDILELGVLLQGEPLAEDFGFVLLITPDSRSKHEIMNTI